MSDKLEAAMTLISELVELLRQCPVLPLQVSSNVERSVSSLVVHKLTLISTTALLRALSHVELEVSAVGAYSSAT